MRNEETRLTAGSSGLAAQEQSTNLQHALAYAVAGWRVFPCVEAGPQAKAPRTPHGHLDASNDLDVIRSWWARWPEALIGAAVPDGLLVLDIDPRNGGSLDAFEALVGNLPETLTCWSGRNDGGRHLYFLRPPGALTSTRLPEGVDLKVNGYVIVPPSPHPATGQPYRWEDRPIAAPTGKLRELLRAPAPRPRLSHASDSDGAPLVRFVAKMTSGERNNALYWAARRACDAGILDALAYDLIAAAVGAGLTEREAQQTIRSAGRAVAR